MTIHRGTQFGFTGGVISPEAQGRIDVDKYQLGLEIGHNCIVRTLGPVQNRPGFEFVDGFAQGATYAETGRVIPFRRSGGFDDILIALYLDTLYVRAEPMKTYAPSAIVAATSDGTRTQIDYSGDLAAEPYLYDGGYVRLASDTPGTGNFGEYLGDKFYRVVNLDTAANTFYIEQVHGGDVDSSGFTYDPAETLLLTIPYALPFTLTEQQAKEITYAQIDNDLFLAHIDLGVYRLHIDSFTDDYTSWYFEQVDFSRDYSSFSPVNATSTPTGAGAKEYKYQVTAVNYEGVESEPSSAVSAGTANSVTAIAFKTQTFRSRFGTSTQNVALEVTCTTLTGLIHGEKARLASVTGAPELEGKTFKVSYGIWNSWGSVFPAAGKVLLVTESNSCPSWGGNFTSGTATLTADYSTNDLSVAGQYNTIEWDQVNSARQYRVYKRSENSGVFGYIGSTTTLSFKDDNIVPDESVTPPQRDNPFFGPDNTPAAISGHVRRMCFGGTRNGPAYLWATGINEIDAFMASFPPNADDAFSLRATAVQGRIAHLVSLDHLIAFTTREEIAYLTPNAEAMTPTNVVPRVQSRIGCDPDCQPLPVGSAVLFSAAANAHIYALSRATDYVFSTDDLSVLASHLLDGKRVVSSAFTEMPDPVAWFVLDDGTALSLTFLPSQKVIAWCSHDTDGEFKYFASVREGGVDVLYAVVVREAYDGNTVALLERMSRREETTRADCVYVDSAIVWDNPGGVTAGTIEITGDGHFEGRDVAVLADGVYLGLLTVVDTGGGTFTITLPDGVDTPTKAIIGLPYTSTVKTLPPAIGGAFGDTVNVHTARMKLRNTRGVKVGVDAADLWEPLGFTLTETGDDAPALASGVVDMLLPGDWNQTGQVILQQDYPLPFTLTALVLDIARG